MQTLIEATADRWASRGGEKLRPDLEQFADRLAGALITGDTSAAPPRS